MRVGLRRELLGPIVSGLDRPADVRIAGPLLFCAAAT